jgi:hypothetical protein
MPLGKLCSNLGRRTCQKHGRPDASKTSHQSQLHRQRLRHQRDRRRKLFTKCRRMIWKCRRFCGGKRRARKAIPFLLTGTIRERESCPFVLAEPTSALELPACWGNAASRATCSENYWRERVGIQLTNAAAYLPAAPEKSQLFSPRKTPSPAPRPTKFLRKNSSPSSAKFVRRILNSWASIIRIHKRKIFRPLRILPRHIIPMRFISLFRRGWMRRRQSEPFGFGTEITQNY